MIGSSCFMINLCLVVQSSVSLKAQTLADQELSFKREGTCLLMNRALLQNSNDLTAIHLRRFWKRLQMASLSATETSVILHLLDDLAPGV